MESLGHLDSDGDAFVMVATDCAASPDTPATEVVSREVIDVVTKLDNRLGVALTAHDLWRTIASFGGYLNRKSDGPPGWQTLWKGWLYLQTVLQGVRLATRFPPP